MTKSNSDPSMRSDAMASDTAAPLRIPPLGLDQPQPSLAQLGEALRAQPQNTIRHAAWDEFPYRPTVHFAIAYTATELALRFQVQEQAVLAQHAQTNDPVCRDSCVELFFSPPGATDYINLEFNCIATVLGERGTGRGDRKRFSPAALDRIRRVSSLGDQPIPLREAETEWELIAAVPLDLLDLPGGERLAGVACRGNVYKCGDDLPTPHYVSWRRIGTVEPDFHRPEYFGPIVFS